MNLDSLESMRGGARRQAERADLTPTQKRQLEQEAKAARKAARQEQYRRQMEQAAQVIELDPIRRENRRKLGLED
jgi:hypothetical protein